MKTILLMTHEVDGQPLAPHLPAIERSNPDATVHLVIGEESPNGKRDSWKNSDRALRRWWFKHCHEVQGDMIHVIEYDTLIEVPLPDMPDEADMLGALVMSRRADAPRCARRVMRDPDWTPDNWWWWHELPMLNLPVGWGLVSFGFMPMRRWVLDAIADERWTGHYARNIQNELRTPSIAAACGARIQQMMQLGVSHTTVTPSGPPGIWHAVKEAMPERLTFESGKAS